MDTSGKESDFLSRMNSSKGREEGREPAKVVSLKEEDGSASMPGDRGVKDSEICLNREFAAVLNHRTSHAIEELIRSRKSVDEIALFLRYSHDLNPLKIGEVLGSPDQRMLDVLNKYCKEFKWAGVPLDIALRIFLGRFHIPGEAQKIDRILQMFSCCFFEQQSKEEGYISADIVHVLSFSAILLHTSVHNLNIGHNSHMTQLQYIDNLKGLEGLDGTRLPMDILIRLYKSFTLEPIRLIAPNSRAMNAQEVEVRFGDGELGLQVETSLNGFSCVVRNYTNKNSAVWSTREKIDLEGWVITAINEDAMDGLHYEQIVWMLRTAHRPVTIRFCEPTVYYQHFDVS